MLSSTRPRLAVEVGGSPGILAQLAAHTDELHCIAAGHADVAVEGVAVHSGPDLPSLLADLLRRLEDDERTVELLFVEGELHAPAIRGLVEIALDSSVTGHTWILVHGAMSREVRAALEAVRPDGYPKVASVDWDWLPGRLVTTDGAGWRGRGGLGLVVTDRTRLAYFRNPCFRGHEDIYHAVHDAVQSDPPGPPA
jgi:hypothetical protein